MSSATVRPARRARLRAAVIASALAAVALSGCSSPPAGATGSGPGSGAAGGSSASDPVDRAGSGSASLSFAAPAHRAVVIVSGGDAVSPFTTPSEACTTGLAAGNTDTALRAALLAAGQEVYTAPAMNARSAVVEPDPSAFGAFGGCPPALPASMTILSNGDIDNGGEHLAHFVDHLHERYGITEIDWVGHSNGGLWARSATRILQDTGSPVAVRSLTTVGTPWEGSVPFRIVYGELPESACRENEVCLKLVAAMQQEVAGNDLGLGRQQLASYLLGDQGWNAAQLGVLDSIPVRLIAGGYLTDPAGDPELWPFDGLVSAYSATASGLPEGTAPVRSCSRYPLTHSIYISNVLGLDWQTALTWNDDVMADVTGFVRQVQQGTAPNGQGC
ncbi:esterase/lipase family protein [Nakamurella sp.]|uniref:esterase/lipase family protein n=1 Tax=Nakamurella sp. TaxID=1869182 RepID=UPI003B3B0CCD